MHIIKNLRKYNFFRCERTIFYKLDPRFWKLDGTQFSWMDAA